MFESIYNWVRENVSIVFYLCPCLVCLVQYTIDTVKNYNKDYKKRKEVKESTEKWASYSPTDTVGVVLWRYIIVFCPFLNIMSSIFDAGPRLVWSIGKRFEKFLNIPLVPPLDKK